MSKNNPITKKQRNKRKVILLVIEVLVLLILLGVFYVAAKLSLIEKAEVDVSANASLNEETIEVMEGYTTIALMGVDNRSTGNYETGNSDSIMVVSINNETKEIKICSIYRDTYLNVGNDTFRKCNYAYAHGGYNQCLQMLNTNLDLNIQDFVAVDFNALVDVVDLLGGIDIELTSQEASVMNDKYIDQIVGLVGKSSSYVGSGQQHLDGVQALAYCRIRATAGDDYKRASRQREVLKIMFDMVKQSDLATINSIIDAVFPEIKTNLSTTQILAMASNVFSYSMGETDGFPFDKAGCDTLGKAVGAVVVPITLESNVQQLHEFLYAEEEYEPSVTVQSISNEIINSTGLTQDNAALVQEDY
jgi:LCP family protein required for cell wall assembly